MKYFITPLDPAKATFDDNDIFGRRAFGEHLMTIVQDNHDFELVIGLDAQWGDGKTVFIRQWEHMLNENDFNHVVYYDAFAHDYHEQPMAPFIAEIYKILKIRKINIQAFSKIAINLLSVSTAGIPLANMYSEININEETTDKSLTFGKKLLEKINQFGNKNQDSIQAFKKEMLKKHAEQDNKPIVFIIDELDRCKPSYAIKLLEVIKHLFSVPGIVFVLVVNSQQLRESIKHEYGNGIDAALYMNKFINLWLSLPKNTSTQSSSDNRRYIKHCFCKLELLNSNLTLGRFNIFADIYNLSFREIEKILTQYKLIINVYAENGQEDASLAILYVIIIKVINPKLFDSILNQKATYEELSSNVINRFAYVDAEIYRELRNIFRIFSEDGISDILNTHRLNTGGSTNEADKDYINKNFKLVKSAPLFLANFRN